MHYKGLGRCEPQTGASYTSICLLEFNCVWEDLFFFFNIIFMQISDNKYVLECAYLY